MIESKGAFDVALPPRVVASRVNELAPEPKKP